MDDLHHKLYRRCVRRCFEHDVVCELQWPDLSMLDVFTKKKNRFPWQRKKLERQPVKLSEVLDTSVSSEALRKLDSLRQQESVVIFDEYKDHLEVTHKGSLKASGKTYARVNIDHDKTFVVDVDFGKVEAAAIGSSALDAALKGLRVQQKHFVLRERKRHSLYVVVKLGFAEKIVLARKFQHEDELSADVTVESNIGGGGNVTINKSEQGNFTRNEKSTIVFDCARLTINADNTLTLTSVGAEHCGIDLNETDSGFLSLVSQPFEVLRGRAKLQDVMMAWVKSCPSENVIVLVEELVDLACSSGETATGRQMPVSWLVQAYKPGALTETTEKLLQTLGFTIECPKDEEPEVAWTKPTVEEEQVLTACLNAVSLTEDLSPEQQHALGEIDRSNAQRFIELFNTAADADGPSKPAASKTNAWTSFEHEDITNMSSDPAFYTVLPTIGIHLAIESKTSGIYDRHVMNSSTLKNMAALLYALRTTV